MEYLYLGQSGLRISAIALGTQTFGWNIGLEESALPYHYTEAGATTSIPLIRTTKGIGADPRCVVAGSRPA